MCSSLRSRVVAAHAAVMRAQHVFLQVLADAALSSEWSSVGASSLAAFVADACQVVHPRAREWVRAASALVDRPDLDAAGAAGDVSQDQFRAVRALTVEDPGAAGAWVESLAEWPIAQLTADARRVTASRLERCDDGRFLSIGLTADERFVRLRGQLHPEEGAVVMRALDRAMRAETHRTLVDAARPDALVAMAHAALDGGGASAGRADRATVVVHVAERGVGEIEAGTGFVPSPVVERLVCDGRVETVVHDQSGQVVGVGRASRTVPGWLYRQVRDRGCVFPGCQQTRWLHAHHVQPWQAGGPTDLANLRCQ